MRDTPSMALAGDVTDLDRVLADVRAHYAAERHSQVLATADALWALHGDIGDARLGECWRFAMIGASRNPDGRGVAAVWRARARSAFARSGCQNGAALTMLADFFYSAEVYEDRPDVAFAILDAMVATAGGPEHPVASDLVRNVYYEKRGFLRAKLGSAQNDRELLDEAREDYNRALEFSDVDQRRRLKIRAGQSSVDYLLAESDDSRRAAITSLTRIVAEAEAAAGTAGDVIRIGRSNLQRMRSDARNLEPYENL